MLKYALAAAAAVAAVSPANAVSLIVNGSFEDGVRAPGGGFSTLFTGNTDITGWVVTGTSIDWIGTYWQASNGSRSIDLAGSPGPGGISQTFNTIAGMAYNVVFDLSGNPDGQAPNVKVTTTSPGGNQFSYDRSVQQNSYTDMKYQTHSFTFVAGGPTSTISFASGLLDGNSGPVIDNVSVSAVPETLTWGMMVIGFGAMGAAMRRRRPADAFAL